MYRNRSVAGIGRWVAAIVIMVAPARGHSQEPESPAAEPAAPPAERPRLVAVRTSEVPDIDGDLRDAAWRNVTPTTAFTQKFPDERHAPSEATELRVLYDDTALYIAFNCVQSGAAVRGRLARRDRQVESDWVQVAVDDGTNTYEFSVNAAGVLGDGVRFNDTDYSRDWDGVWDAKVARSDGGWTAELWIPLRIFHRSTDSRDWGFQARRYISERQETDEWAFIPRSVAGEVSHYGWLSGITGLRRSNPLEFRPYVSAGTRWADLVPGSHGLGNFGYGMTAGLDLAWRVSGDLTLDASLNPDFAQVEADQLVLNLTTYETFVPEKRPFFVNGLAVFQPPRLEIFPTPQTLFYTRRIGSVPAIPVVGDGAGETASPEPTTIYAAAKLTGQLGGGVSIGLLSAAMGRNDVDVALTGRPSQQVVAEPLALANVARIKVDVGRGANLGVLATAMQRFEPHDAYPVMAAPGGARQQQCPDGAVVAVGARCFHDGYVAGIDGSWRSSSGTYDAAGQVFATAIENGPTRTVPDGTIIKSGDVSPGGRLYLAKEGGHWLGSFEVQALGRRVDYNDLGYLQRANLVRFLPYLGYRTLEPFWDIAETETHVYVAARDSLDGVTLLRGYYGGTKVRFKNFWIAAAEIYRYGTRFEDRNVGDGTAIQRPSADGLDVSISTDPRQQLAAAVSTETLVYRKGGKFALDGELTYQPLPRIELQLLPQLTLSSGDSWYISGSRATGKYVFGELRARAVGATLRTSYAFTNRLTLQLYGQVLLIAKHYSNFTSYSVDPAAPRPAIRLEDLQPVAPGEVPMPSPDTAEADLNLNAVLRWEFRPGSTLFLVYTRSQAPDLAPMGDARLDLGSLRSGPAADAIRLKLSYYWN